jgi:hypothetical protein
LEEKEFTAERAEGLQREEKTGEGLQSLGEEERGDPRAQAGVPVPQSKLRVERGEVVALGRKRPPLGLFVR